VRRELDERERREEAEGRARERRGDCSNAAVDPKGSCIHTRGSAGLKEGKNLESDDLTKRTSS